MNTKQKEKQRKIIIIKNNKIQLKKKRTRIPANPKAKVELTDSINEILQQIRDQEIQFAD